MCVVLSVVVVVVERGARAQTRDAEASVRANMRARETAARRNGRVHGERSLARERWGDAREGRGDSVDVVGVGVGEAHGRARGDGVGEGG